jgi:hypothetical protein
MLRKTVIEEGIYNIDTRESIKKAIFTTDGYVQTRQLIGYSGGWGDDVIDKITNITLKKDISLHDALSDNFDYESIMNDILTDLKERILTLKNSYDRNVQLELQAFDNPIVIES